MGGQPCVRPLDLDQPLWRAVLVDGLPEGGFAVLLVVHHILIDGLAGVRLAGSLFDSSPDAGRRTHRRPLRHRLPTHSELVRDMLRTLRVPRRRRRTARRATWPPDGRPPRTPCRASGLRYPPHHCHDRSACNDGRSRRRSRWRRSSAPDTPWEPPCNDLVLAMVTDGLRDLLAGRAELHPGLFLRTTVPVATGRAGQAMGMLVVDLPVGEPDPRQRLALITTATTAGKARLRATGDDVTAILHLPVPLLRLFVRWGRRVGSSRINLSVSNVPGPDAHLWLAGARMERAVPIAPLVPLVPLSVAALSYSGSLTIAVNADAAITDLALMAPAMTQALRRYQELV